MIYLDYWGLSRPPFTNDHRPEAFVPNQSAALVMGRLRYALGMNLGAAGLFGEPGVGKTQLIRTLLTEFAAAGWLVAYIPNPGCTTLDLLSLFSRDAALAVRPGESGLAELERFLAGRLKVGRPVLAAVDDVQAARSGELLETLRTMLNIEEDGRRALSLLLAGQAGMERKLELSSGFNTQLAVRALLSPMRPEETKLYVLSRLKAAGSRHGIFTRQAAERLVSLSGGAPRQVNRLCELALVTGFGLDAKKITPDIVDMAAADLDMLSGAENAVFPWPGKPMVRQGELATTPPEEDILASLAVEAP